MAATTTIQVKVNGKPVEFTQGDFREIQPGEWVAVCPPSMVPKTGVVKFRRAEGGLWQPVILALPTLVYRRQWKEEWGCSWKAAVKLAYAGFIEYRRLLPQRIAIDLESFFDHSRRVHDDRGFWTPERRKRLADVEGDMRAGRADPDADDEDADEDDANKGDLRGPELALGV